MKLSDLDDEIRIEDKDAFTEKVYEQLSDRRINNFVDRGVVNKHDVVTSLAKGEAFEQALGRETYGPYAVRRASVLASPIFKPDLHDQMLSPRRLATMLGLAFICYALLNALLDAHFMNFAIILTSASFIGVAASISRYALRSRLSLGDHIAIAALITVSSAVIVIPHFVFHVRWEPVTFVVIWVVAATTGYFSGIERTFIEALYLYRILFNSAIRPIRNLWLAAWRKSWLNDCVESIIIPQAILAINDILGEDKDRLLVEQNSEGLRKLLDPDYTIATRSEERIVSVLSQMDGGSIALAGPRGAGKSTLLREFTLPAQARYTSGLSVFLEAPAEYIPRDFIAEVLQQLCKAFLDKEQCSAPKNIYRESLTFNPGRIMAALIKAIWISCRAIAALAVLAWLTWAFWRTTYLNLHQVIPTTVIHWYRDSRRDTSNLWHSYRFLSRIAILSIAVIIFPGPNLWRRYLSSKKEPDLARTARMYLERLQVEKTITSGSGISLPIARSSSLNISKGSSAKYSPWTLPELVNNTRDFMKHLASYYEDENYPVMIGIDEIDRIGSLEHAERFIGEIKAIFGIERCFFLVSVAEDVGSVFAQRAIAGRSILENAFDNIIVVEPLRLQETREFLLKRVPGFTDSFAYLVHALSGGLPRELIRITRRLVEINEGAPNSDCHLRLEDLAAALVYELLAEAIRATRGQMSRLILSAHWAGALETLHSANAILGGAEFSSKSEKYDLIQVLSRPQPIDVVVQGSHAPGDSMRDEDRARILIADLLAFAYFGLTVIDSFDDIRFNLQEVQRRTQAGREGSYETLALARNELAVSSASSRIMLQRFRENLKLQ